MTFRMLNKESKENLEIIYIYIYKDNSSRNESSLEGLKDKGNIPGEKCLT